MTQKTFIYAIILACLILTGCSPSAEPETEPPEAETTTMAMADIDPDLELRGFSDAFVAAWNVGDVAALTALFDIDADVIDPFGVKTSGRDAIGARYEELLNGKFKNSKFDIEPHLATWLTDSVAVISGTYAITREDQTLANAVFTNVVRRDGSGFLLEAVRMTIPVDTAGSSS